MEAKKSGAAVEFHWLSEDAGNEWIDARQGRQLSIKVKGSLIIDYVRMIRAYKEKDWDKYLRPQDWKIVNSSVLSSRWYPFEFFSRTGEAVFKEIAESNLETAREFGRFALNNFLEIYKNILVPGEVGESLKKLAEIRNLVIKGNPDMEVAGFGSNWMKYKVTAPLELVDPELLLAFCYQIAGSAEAIVRRASGTNPSTFVDQNDRGCEITVKWE